MPTPQEFRRPSFLLRAAAYLIDGTLIMIPVAALHYGLVAITLGDLQVYLFKEAVKPVRYAYVLVTTSVVPWCLYFGVFERSRWQATPGKQLVGLLVTDTVGRRIGWRRSILRTTIKLLPWEIGHVAIILVSDIRVSGLAPPGEFRFNELTRFHPDPAAATAPMQGVAFVLYLVYVGLAMAQRNRRTVHDLVTGTKVLERRPTPKPKPVIEDAGNGSRPR